MGAVTRELGEMKPKYLFHEELSQLMELLDLDAFSILFFSSIAQQ